MKTSRRFGDGGWKAAFGAAAVCFVAGSAPAASVTWDADTGTAGAQDGGGTWDGAATNWWNGSTNVVWPDTTADTAVIGTNSGAAGTITVSGTRTLNRITFNAPGSGTYTLSGGTLSLGGTTPTITANTNAAISSTLSGTNGLTKSGAGMVTLKTVNTYSGKTVIDGGTLAADDTGGVDPDGKFGAIPGSFQADNITIKNGGALYWIEYHDGPALHANRGVYLDAGVQNIHSSYGDFYINGVISGPGGLLHGNIGQGGYRRLYLNAANTFTGDTKFDATGSMSAYGGIEIVNPLALQYSAFDTSSVGSTLGNPAALVLGGLVGSVNISGLLTTPALTSLTLQPQLPGVTKTYSGVISSVASMTLTKAGAGIQVLSGANTYTGWTTVSNGTLLINNVTGSGTGTNGVTVKTNAVLGGTGFIAGPTTIESGGHLAPGGSNAVGTLTFSGNNLALVFTNDAVLDCEIGDGSTTNDRVNLTGTSATIAFGTTATLNFSKVAGATNNPSGKIFVLFKYTGSDPSPLPTWTFNFGTNQLMGGSVSLDSGGKRILLSKVYPTPHGTVISVR